MDYNVYCDETCHLEHDKSNAMALGAVWCDKELAHQINMDIKAIKQKNGFSSMSEAKWTKVCRKHILRYQNLSLQFFKNPHLHFRCVLIPRKDKLRHEEYHQTHDDWYYKMYFNLLKTLFSPRDTYNIYIDIKDTHSFNKAQKLRDVCCNNMYDFKHDILHKVQPIRSDEVEIMQIVDILIGAICYNSRNFPTEVHLSPSKRQLIEQIKVLSGYSLTKSTLYREDKFNLFVWKQDYNTGELYHDY